MKFRAILLPAALIPVLLSGCAAKTAFDVVTAPVRVVGKGVDLATTSQSEADENRGRELRKREEKLGKLERQWRKLDEQCTKGKADACRKRDEIGVEIDAILPTLPARTRD